MNKTTLYIGLNDKDTKRQEIETLEASKIVTRLLVDLCGGGTIYNATGIYTHDNGEIVIENTLRVEIIEADPDAVLTVCRRIKTALNQETVIAQTEAINTIAI